jgi:3-dehydroquinate synthase
MSITVSVSLGARSYAIHIGNNILAQSGAILKPLADAAQPVPVITDETVEKLYYKSFAASLEAEGLKPVPIVIPPGEHSKSFAQLEKVIDALLAHNIERGGLVVALGGGVVGDLTGFAAGIYKRGIAFAQVPTTLLAQVDSSVGGKTAIDTARGKNLVGVFHQPRVVIADTAVLATLPKRELLSGYAEVMKYGLLGDADFFAWLEANAAKALRGDNTSMIHAVAHSCTMKAEIVSRDEREAGDRALLNLGHTFGHALEAATGYSDRLTHGEGVAIGCLLALKLSAALGLAAPAEVARVEAHLKAVGLPASINDIPGPRPNVDTLIDHMRHDKKASGGKLTFILTRGIGKAFVNGDVTEAQLKAILAEN